MFKKKKILIASGLLLIGVALGTILIIKGVRKGSDNDKK